MAHVGKDTLAKTVQWWKHLFVAVLLFVTSTEPGIAQTVNLYLKNTKYQIILGPGGVPYQVKGVPPGTIVYPNGATMHTVPDSAGRFVFDNLDPGKYVLLFDAPKGYRGVSAVAGSKVAIVNGVQVVTLSLQVGAHGGSANIEITGNKGRIVGKVTPAPAPKTSR